MIDNLLYYLEYYMNVLIALCGFDGSAGNDVVGWFVVASCFACVFGVGGVCFCARCAEDDGAPMGSGLRDSGVGVVEQPHGGRRSVASRGSVCGGVAATVGLVPRHAALARGGTRGAGGFRAASSLRDIAVAFRVVAMPPQLG